MKKKQNITTEAYLKEKIETKKMNISYNKGKNFGIEDMQFNFTSSPCKEPYGDVSFTTGYDNDPKYTSTFLMTAQEALNLGKMLIDTAYEAMTCKRIIQEAELCDAKLSFLVLKGLIDTIRIERCNDNLKNYNPPYYKYIVSAYKDNEKIYSYATVYNLSYFTSEAELNYWIDKLTDKQRVKIYFTNWNPHVELEERREELKNRAIKSMDKINLKPNSIEK